MDAYYVEMVLATLEQLKVCNVQVGLISNVARVEDKVSAKVTALELKIELENTEPFCAKDSYSEVFSIAS